jgi:DNA-binding response OmpR family regulator
VENSETTPVMILLVEDEPLISLVTAESLGDAGFVVEEASSAAEAMAKLKAATVPFEAAIIDLGLPDMPGDRLAQEIRRERKGFPIVIASGRDGREVVHMFRDEGNVAVVNKPYDSSALVAALLTLGVSASRSGA